MDRSLTTSQIRAQPPLNPQDQKDNQGESLGIFDLAETAADAEKIHLKYDSLLPEYVTQYILLLNNLKNFESTYTTFKLAVTDFSDILRSDIKPQGIVATRVFSLDAGTLQLVTD